ncbi:MAG: hypothetical protein GY944_21995, partial [bacterium]|nr:hypothetical protein [bacterium]
NRHCPKCQTLAKLRWREDRKSDLLPVPYFHQVFTLPHELNALVLRNQRVMLKVLFRATSETLLAFGRRKFGGKIGFTLVLHTWDQRMHAHYRIGFFPAWQGRGAGSGSEPARPGEHCRPSPPPACRQEPVELCRGPTLWGLVAPRRSIANARIDDEDVRGACVSLGGVSKVGLKTMERPQSSRPVDGGEHQADGGHHGSTPIELEPR